MGFHFCVNLEFSRWQKSEHQRCFFCQGSAPLHRIDVRCSRWSSTMASIPDERTNKRAAASKAVGKIKETLEELSGWSASDDASSASSDVCRRLSDFDDLDGHSNKKSRTEDSDDDIKSSVESKSSSKEDVAPEKDPTMSEEASSTEATEGKDHDTATTKNFSSSANSSSSSSESSTESPVQNTADALKTEREQRAEARNQHSTGPMILSRRLSWQLQREPSPVYSPITAKQLSFTPRVVKVKTNRAH